MSRALDRVEKDAADAVAGAWGRQVEEFRTALLALWSANGNTLTAAQVRALAYRLDVSVVAPDPALLLAPAARLGDARVRQRTATRPASRDVQTIVGAVGSKPGAAVAEMRLRAGALDLDSLSGVLGVVGPLGRSVAEMRGAASYAVQRTANEAAIAAVDQTDNLDVVFVPERDACTDCIVRGGETGDAVRNDPPPVHPWCRCEVEGFEDPEVPKALARESVRSVLRGFSLPSESEAERLRAAKKMLASRPVAPKSVQDYARRAIERGEFPRGRGVPGSR